MDLDLFFPPWIGCDYGKEDNLFNGQKIMVVGHNHHDLNDYDKCHGCGHLCKNYGIPQKCNGQHFTLLAVSDYVKCNDVRNPQRYYRTFDKFTQALSCHCSKKDVWESIAFYNFLQRAVPEQGARGHSEEIRLSKHAFLYLLNALPYDKLPDLIIAWGEKNVYWNISEFFHENMPELIYNKKGWIKRGIFQGKEITLICIHHPSFRFFDPDRWRSALAPFICNREAASNQ